MDYSDYMDAWILADRAGIPVSRYLEKIEKNRERERKRAVRNGNDYYKKKSAAYRKKHPGYNKAACKRYRDRDPEAFRKYQHEYYLKKKRRKANADA